MKDYSQILQSLEAYLEYLSQDSLCNPKVIEYVKMEIEKIQQLGFSASTSWIRSICTDSGRQVELHMHIYRLGQRRCQSWKQKPDVTTLLG